MSKYGYLHNAINLKSGSVQISSAANVNIWEPLNKKGLHFLHININSLLSKIDELKRIVNKTKAAIIGITESKLDHTVQNKNLTILYLISKVMMFSDVTEIEMVMVLLVI